MAKNNKIGKPVIALLTDYGLENYFVSVLKGVILGICKNARIIDITHNIPAFDIERAAIVLEASYSFFPRGTVFCCVIDPEVGSKRLPICATDGEYFFVAPDNGLLAGIQANAKKKFQAYQIKNPEYMRKKISATFHGRDIFSPAASHIARGVHLNRLGKPVKKIKLLKRDILDINDSSIIQGTVLYADQFGNLVTNFHKRDRKRLPRNFVNEKRWVLKIKGKKIKGISRTFSSQKPGTALFYWGSGDYLEIAVNQGNAKNVLKLDKGSKFILEFAPPEK